MVTRTKGSRRGTRSILSKDKRNRRRLFIGRVMHTYEEGDRVAIVLDGAQQKGMPHRRFQGRTGVISGTQGRAYVIRVSDGNMPKTVVARPEHLRPIE
ncbi:MAG TPA: 50S ribosomal protein L21e [Candidatus Thalassarchaeaceae archaeon]|jgi:large subunit ribosomal protein L21e|nr:50S ribosomal protein L21e [Candidatus Thalassarchaeaceae archaeon]|tara:strand:+ start:68012 stop:68305 length:294 start_codon:yes stop_codon:yes gene_type:complete